MPTSITPQDFVAKWRRASLSERSSYQQHFLDICALIGHAAPAEVDPAGKFFTFEAGAAKQDGGQGWADVWFRDHFAWEYKGKHANLDKAYQQLLQYREALENPPLLIVSDIDSIVIHTNFTNTVKRVYTLALDDLLQPDQVTLLRSVFYNPDELKAPQTTWQVTEEAASHFARLAQQLRGYGEQPAQIAHFLIQLLFCLFAEDVGMLPDRLFTQLIANARGRSGAFKAQLEQLFGAMSTGGWFGSNEILHFDGRLFEDASVLELDGDGMYVLSEVSKLDWSSIEPSIFGTLFERSLDPGKRSQLGAHYTSKEDILLIIEPVLMAPLRRRWREVQDQARELATKREEAKTKGQRTKFHNQLSSLLVDFAGEISSIHVLDPACGSGNFLYVALRQLLDLEKEVVTLAGDLGVGRFFLNVSPSQLHGIEINPYAHQLAQATIWIGYIQWLRENGYGFPEQPILKPLDNILHMDAVLGYDADSRPYEPEWPAADVIVGNPPFLGGKKMRTELGDSYIDELFNLYQNRVPHEVDYVCYWFEKSRHLLGQGGAKRAGLLATQGIRGGANRKILKRIKETSDIFWAMSDRDWVLDGANVHVSMIGFGETDEEKYLNGRSVTKINSDLSSTAFTTNAVSLLENRNLSFMGVTPAGSFDVPNDLAHKWLSTSGNPNNRPNSDVVYPYFNGVDLTTKNRDVWIVDFSDYSEKEAALFEKPFEYIKKNVFPERITNRRAAYAKNWWKFAEARPGMRKALKPLNRYIGTSMVSKHRIFSWLPKNVIPANLVIVFARDDDYFFGVLNSKPHQLWALRMGTALEDRPRYTPTTTFETFPFPWAPGKEPEGDPRVEAIASAARELVDLRDAWLNPPGLSSDELQKRTLTNLYNQRPTWLDLAHRKLDRAVFAAYGWPDDLADEQILERLLNLNLERASNQHAA